MLQLVLLAALPLCFPLDFLPSSICKLGQGFSISIETGDPRVNYIFNDFEGLFVVFEGYGCLLHEKAVHLVVLLASLSVEYA